MNVLTYIIFLFIYLNVLFYFNIPSLSDDNYIYHKLILFINIFVFNFFTQIITKIRNKCNTTIENIISKSLKIATYTIIGYSLFIDLKIMNSTKKYVEPYISDSQSQMLFVSTIISMFVLIMKLIEIILNNTNDACVKIPKITSP